MTNKISLSDFKPSDMRKQVLTTKELINILHLDNIECSRLNYNEGKWSLRQMSRFIESMLMNLPQEPIIADSSFSQWFIIKGLEQLIAIRRFITGQFTLSNIYFRSEVYYGKTWNDLSLTSKQKINNLKFNVYVVNKSVDTNTRFGLYMLLNPAATYKRMSDYRQDLFPVGYTLFKSWIRENLNQSLIDNEYKYLPKLELALLHLSLLYTYLHNPSFGSLLRANIEYASNYALIDLQLQHLEDFKREYSLTRIFENTQSLNTLTRFRATMKAETYLIVNALGIRNIEESFGNIWEHVSHIIKDKDSSLENMIAIRDYIKNNLI